VLNLSPPLSLETRWLAPHVAYTISKYGMSLCTLGHAGELALHGIAVNSLWPRTVIATAALQMIPGIDPARCRRPEIVADAAWYILTGESGAATGRFFIDEEVLRAHGISDLDRYAVAPGTRDLLLDLFLD
jgi:citronellol/citronellal dehydrogenase